MEETIKLTPKDKELFERVKTNVINEARQKQIDNVNKYWDEFENNYLKKAIVTFRKLQEYDDEIISEIIEVFSIFVCIDCNSNTNMI